MDYEVNVGELIKQLSKFDMDKPVCVSAIGFSIKDSWDKELNLGEITVDEFDGKVMINFSII